jgi:hypothetical protein
MNRIKLAVLSLIALAFACPIGFRTANAKGEQSTADKVEDATLGKPVEDKRPLEEQVADLRAQLAAVQNAVPGAVVAPPTVTGSTQLLIQGAGVDAKDVTWRITAGLTPAQAVEVALQEKNEAASRKEAKK